MSTCVQRAWMVVASGGKWTGPEVKQELPSQSVKAVESALRKMSDGGCLTKFGDGRYGVTHDCMVPRGLTVFEVLQVIGAAK